MPPTTGKKKSAQRQGPYDRPTTPVAAAAAQGPEGGLLEIPSLYSEPYVTTQPIDAWHYTVELKNFASKIDDPKLTVAINAIIKKLQPGEVAKTPEEIFQQVEHAIESLAESDTKSYAKAASAATAVAAGLVYQNYTQHVAEIQANQGLVCRTLGIICPTIPTLGEYVVSSMPAVESVSETATAILAIALFSVKLKAQYDVLKNAAFSVFDLTSTIFDYFRTDKQIEADPGAEPGGAAAASSSKDQEEINRAVNEINRLLASLKVDLAAIPTEMGGGRRRRRRQTRRRKTRRHKAKRRTKKRSCCSKRRRKTRHRHRKNRRQHRQTRR